MGMIVGVDYASVDQNSTPNYDTLRRACIAAGSTAGFAIMRGAYGTWPDPVVQRDWRAATAAKLTCGAYLFLRLPIQGYSGTPRADAGGLLGNRALGDRLMALIAAIILHVCREDQTQAQIRAVFNAIIKALESARDTEVPQA